MKLLVITTKVKQVLRKNCLATRMIYAVKLTLFNFNKENMIILPKGECRIALQKYTRNTRADTANLLVFLNQAYYCTNTCRRMIILEKKFQVWRQKIDQIDPQFSQRGPLHKLFYYTFSKCIEFKETLNNGRKLAHCLYIHKGQGQSSPG